MERKTGQNGKQRTGDSFDSVRKRMSVLFKEENNQRLLYTKGAPDIVLNLCTHILINNQEVPLTQELER